MQVVKITPKELPTDLIFRLNYVYKIELGEFVAISNNKEEILYVNHTIPQKDIDGFLEVIAFPHYWVADETVTETGRFLQYVYDKYGFGTYSALLDSHEWRMKHEAEQRAKEMAKTIIPLIEKEVNSEMPIVVYDENLLHEVFCAGSDRKGKTPENISGYSSVYLFYLGYLMGSGMTESGMDIKMKFRTETARIMRQLNDVERLKKVYTVAKTLLDISQEEQAEKGGVV